MSQLPQIQTTDPALLRAALLQWRSALNPALANELVQGRPLTNVSLTAGQNVINHGLGRALVGWFPTRLRDQATWIYDTQDTNSMPQLTLVLWAADAINVDLWVF